MEQAQLERDRTGPHAGSVRAAAPGADGPGARTGLTQQGLAWSESGAWRGGTRRGWKSRGQIGECHREDAHEWVGDARKRVGEHARERCEEEEATLA